MRSGKLSIVFRTEKFIILRYFAVWSLYCALQTGYFTDGSIKLDISDISMFNKEVGSFIQGWSTYYLCNSYFTMYKALYIFYGPLFWIWWTISIGNFKMCLQGSSCTIKIEIVVALHTKTNIMIPRCCRLYFDESKTVTLIIIIILCKNYLTV